MTIKTKPMNKWISDLKIKFKALFKKHRKEVDDSEIQDDQEDDQEHDLKSQNSKSNRYTRGLNGSEEEEIIPRPPLAGKMFTFFHIGSLAKECLCRGYNTGVWQLDCSTGSKEYFSTYTFGKADPDLNTVSGSVGLTQQFGIFTLGQAWKTDGYLGLIGVDTEELGAKFYSILSAHSVKDDSASAKIDLLAGFERSPIKTEVIIPILKSPKFLGYLLLEPIEHFVLACRMEFNIEERAIDAHAFCIGYTDETTEYGLKLENFKDVRGSVFQRLGDKWGVALKANLFGKDMKKFTVGGQYQINEKTLIKARICDTGLTGLVYQIKLNDNVEGNYYFGFDANSPLKGEHKIGIAWRFRG